MAAAPVPPSAIPPSLPASPTLPLLSPPPAASPPRASQPNANADPPSPPNSPPPVTSSPPPALSPPPVPNSPPPNSPPPVASPPPVTPSPPPVTPSPPPVTPSPSPPTISSPPPSTPPSTPLLSPPPPSGNPPSSSPPPPPTKSPSPPVTVPSPPVSSPPHPITEPPPTPAKPSPTTPSSAPPPSSPPKVKSSPPSELPSPPPPPPRNQIKPVPSSPTPATPSPEPPAPPGSPPTNPTPSGPPSGPPTPVTSSPPVLSPPVPLDTPVAPGTPTPSKTSNSNVTSPGNTSSTGRQGVSTGAAVGIAVVASFVVLSLVGILLWSIRKRKKQVGSYGHVMPSPFQSSQMSESSYSRSPTPLIKTSSGSHGFPFSPSDPGLGHSKSLFTYEELSEATNGFSTQNLLGEGGFGCVYKGCLPVGREVAVKQLKDGSGQGEREFMAEVETISRVHHRHLVSLVGYCVWESQRLLVYDYVPNNTLYYHLHGQGRPVMDWATRVKAASGAARGLAYLHEDCHPRIIHRDIKSSNILLDNNFEAQVSDFGLAKLAMDAHTHVTTRVMGTFGYLAPEYASSGKLTDKSDVFSFGVVLLELITGRKPVDASQPLGDESLVEWARPLMAHALDSRDFDDLPDPRLEKNYNENKMFRMIEVAAACVRHSASMRPRMGQVVRALDGLDDHMDLQNGVRPGQSELFNSAQQSAEIRLFQRMAFGSQDYSSDFSQAGWNSRREL